MSDFELEFDDLSSAEDFLDYFEIPFDPAVVQVNRLHIMQRYHDYLANTEQPEDPEAQRQQHRTLLEKAYGDFVDSDALSEKVFKVFHMNKPREIFVPLDQLFKG